MKYDYTICFFKNKIKYSMLAKKKAIKSFTFTKSTGIQPFLPFARIDPLLNREVSYQLIEERDYCQSIFFVSVLHNLKSDYLLTMID